MGRIEETFRDRRQRGECALIVYLPVGFPTRAETAGLVRAACEAGADIIELGVPFSDPLADGPTIQRASRVALDQGVTVDDCLEAVRGLRRGGLEAPIALMGYVNPFLAYGPGDLGRDALAAGVDGLIIPDLPPGAIPEWTGARAPGLDRIQFIAPTTRAGRLGAIAGEASGFLYCLSVAGVTGARAGLPSSLAAMIARVRRASDLPVAVGFGIATPAQVREVAGFADGAIVGSALIEAIERAPDGCRAEAATRFVAALKEATRAGVGTVGGRWGDDRPSEDGAPVVNEGNEGWPRG